MVVAEKPSPLLTGWFRESLTFDRGETGPMTITVTTTHIAQVTGTPDFVSAAVRGVDLGASAVFKDHCYVFFGDVPQIGPPQGWSEPWRLAPAGSAAPGGLAASSRDRANLDGFCIGPHGEVPIRSSHGCWGEVWLLAPAGSAAPGGLAASSRDPGNLDVFWIGPYGEVA